MKAWQKYVAIAVAIPIVLYIGLRLIPADVVTDNAFRANGNTDVIAHSGGAGIAPKNTLEAAILSDEAGADIIEMDVRQSSDGYLIALHDATIDATTDGTGEAAGMTLEELQSYNAGYGMLDGEGERPFEYQGVVIPELDNLFIAFSGGRLILELKPAEPLVAEALCKMLGEYEAKPTTLVVSFHQSAIDAFRTACPSVATSLTPDEIKSFILWQRLGLSNLAPVPETARVIAVPLSFGDEVVITKGLIDAAHSRGLAVQAWTINDVEQMKSLKALGVDGIYTDFPAEAKAALE